MKTMDEEYKDESNHRVCEECGYCIDCGDCNKFGCGTSKIIKNKYGGSVIRRDKRR